MLATAIANRERLRFDYSSSDGTESRRLVEPNRLVAAGRRWYFVAYDNDRDEWRILRVERMRDLVPTGLRSAAVRELPEDDAAGYVARKLLDLATTSRVVATLYAPAAEVAGHLGDGLGELEPIDEHSCGLHSHTDTFEWLAFRLATLGCEFDVHTSPPRRVPPRAGRSGHPRRRRRPARAGLRGVGGDPMVSPNE